MDPRIATFVETVRARNWRESIAAVVIIAFLSYRLYADPQTLNPTGAWIVIVACLGIIALSWTALNIPATEPTTHPLEQHKDHWRRRMTVQATALRFAWLWYVLPLFAGVAVILIGRGKDMTTETTVSLVVLGILGAALAYLNFTAAAKMERDRDAMLGGG
jgi:hypothetical protein